MKITAFDDLYPMQLGTGSTTLYGATGSNSGYTGGDVVGGPGDLSVIRLGSTVSLGSNLSTGVALGDVLTIIQASPAVARFATPSNTGSSLPWFWVTSYGATGDGVTDDTSAIQDTIDAAEAAGGGVIYFPAGVYVVAGALADTSRSNSQLVLPIRHTDVTEQITIHLLGETPPPTIPAVVGTIIDPDVGSVIKGTLNTGSGTSPALLGGWGPSGSFENFTMVHARIENLTIRLPSNPVLTALNLSHVEVVELDNVIVDCGEYTIQSLTEPTTTTSYGVRLPGLNNGAHTRLGALNVVGFYTGVEVGEHTVGSQVTTWGCKRSLVFVAAYHASHIDRLMSVHCERGLVFTGGAHYFTIDQYNVEHAASGWWVTDYDIDDASNYGYGHGAWKVTLAGTGHDSTWTVNGGSNQHWIEIGTDPYGGAVSAGSNSTHVRETSTAGASSTLWSPFDHAHAGVAQVTASSSNTLQRGTVNLRAGTGAALTATDSDGDGEFDTVTFHSLGSGTGASVSYGSNATRVSEMPTVGTLADVARADHIHDGIGTVTASSSNTLQRGTWNVRPGAGIALNLTDSDGDGEFDTVTIASTGSVVNTGAPVRASGARAYNSTSINLNNGSVTLLTFDSERWDDAAYHSTSVNTERLTVPSAGRYLVGGHLQMTATGGTRGYLAIREGGATYIAVQNVDLAAGERYASISTVWDCPNGTEYFELGAYIDTTAKQAIASSAFSPEFWIERLGDT